MKADIYRRRLRTEVCVKMKVMKIGSVGRIAMWLFLVSTGFITSLGQTTAFTYQGRITDGGVAPTGNYDIRIQLYDLPSGGNLICGTQGSPNASVANGSFSLVLDFG